MDLSNPPWMEGWWKRKRFATNRIRLFEFNAIGFDLIEFNSISFNQIFSISFPVASVKVLDQLQEGWWPSKWQIASIHFWIAAWTPSPSLSLLGCFLSISNWIVIWIQRMPVRVLTRETFGGVSSEEAKLVFNTLLRIQIQPKRLEIKKKSLWLFQPTQLTRKRLEAGMGHALKVQVIGNIGSLFASLSASVISSGCFSFHPRYYLMNLNALCGIINLNYWG